ncbi:MAG: prepilin-type N-terminal cleavage/methylation domain-containing protein [Anaerocolumna sp.]
MKCIQKHKNAGFTLVELLISISILAIVLLPLLNNFVTAAKVNQKSKRMQNETVLTQTILEEVKALELVDLAARYNYPEDFPEIKDEVLEMVLKNGILEPVTEDEKSVIRNSSEEDTTYILNQDRATYYFAKKNISLSGKTYDALITLDGSTYIEGNTDEASAFNSFSMPVFSDLDAVNNLLILQTYEEDTALNTLYSNHLAYNQAIEEALPSVTPADVPTDNPAETTTDSPIDGPTYYEKDDIKRVLRKEIEVTISSTVPYSVTVTFTYSADEIPGADFVSYTLGQKEVDPQKGSVYIFYIPSAKNNMTIHMNGLISDSIDVYAISQKSDDYTGGELTITDDIIPSGIQLFSNSSVLHALSGGNGLVKKESGNNRIYSVTVELFTAGNHFNRDSLCAEFSSTKKE